MIDQSYHAYRVTTHEQKKSTFCHALISWPRHKAIATILTHTILWVTDISKFVLI